MNARAYRAQFIRNEDGARVTVTWKGQITAGNVLGSIWANYPYPQFTQVMATEEIAADVAALSPN